MNRTTNRAVNIELLGQKITFKSDANPEHLDKVIQFAEQRISDAMSKAQGKGVQAPHWIALLALLDVCDDYLQAEERFGELQSKTRTQVERIQVLFDDRLNAKAASN